MAFDFGGRSLEDEDAMLAALLALHRQKQERARSKNLGSNYERILKHFERRGERLRGESLITAELIERLFRGAAALPAPHVQQELEIVGSPGGIAAGRVRITNRSPARARFDFVIGQPLDGSERPPITFESSGADLEAEESRLFRVQANLVGWKAGSSMTIPVECRWSGGCDHLWLVVSTRSVETQIR